MTDGDLLDLPEDERTAAEAERLGLTEAVVVRDVVRLVEIENLSAQGFFSKRSVLAGSMALRSFGSPRFTVMDADFSTSSETVDPPEAMAEKLTYQGERLSITVESIKPHDAGETNWEAMPIKFDARFTSLIQEPNARFKADISFRGLVRDGLEVPVKVPYDLGLWTPGDEPLVWVMDPHEIVAEKVLGWCVNRRVKHYADLAYIAHAARNGAPDGGPLIELDDAQLRTTLADKLEKMSKLQKELHDKFPNIEGLVGDLARPPQLAASQWNALQYVRGERESWTQERIAEAVRELLVPRLRAPRL